ncbi:unnamed protein product [Mycena citricolor]|uniref:Protein-S-isoprenylcysteine O-methyltransferase n=1 Tax=Mycena citricolor TaxID=2018698 RepID=A0AAD2Q4K7_9AGAR|nr:unnamed protein product [Mycena citricolor]
MSTATPPVNPLHPPPPAKYTGRIPNTALAASTVSFILGSLFSLGFFTFVAGLSNNGLNHTGVWSWWTTPHLAFFAAAWSFFHWDEYAVTVGWNFDKSSVDSFLLENGSLYHIAHSVSIIEYLVTLFFFPGFKSLYPQWLAGIGLVLVLGGQTLRSCAMIHAATNFSHAVAFRKRDDHILVTTGVYAYLRHPSYTGFFWWAVGTQIVLGNPISVVGYMVVMWRFFYYRIKAEERALVVFFGKDYEEYRKRVGTWIPFVP